MIKAHQTHRGTILSSISLLSRSPSGTTEPSVTLSAWGSTVSPHTLRSIFTRRAGRTSRSRITLEHARRIASHTLNENHIHGRTLYTLLISATYKHMYEHIMMTNTEFIETTCHAQVRFFIILIILSMCLFIELLTHISYLHSYSIRLFLTLFTSS